MPRKKQRSPQSSNTYSRVNVKGLFRDIQGNRFRRTFADFQKKHGEFETYFAKDVLSFCGFNTERED